jgi:uncharacterized protein YciI
MNRQDEAGETIEPHRRRLFLVTMTADVAPDRLMPHLADHLEYMTELDRRGVLFASGPFVSADGAPTGEASPQRWVSRARLSAQLAGGIREDWRHAGAVSGTNRRRGQPRPFLPSRGQFAR